MFDQICSSCPCELAAIWRSSAQPTSGFSLSNICRRHRLSVMNSRPSGQSPAPPAATSAPGPGSEPVPMLCAPAQPLSPGAPLWLPGEDDSLSGGPAAAAAAAVAGCPASVPTRRTLAEPVPPGAPVCLPGEKTLPSGGPSKAAPSSFAAHPARDAPQEPVPSVAPACAPGEKTPPSGRPEAEAPAPAVHRASGDAAARARDDPGGGSGDGGGSAMVRIESHCFLLLSPACELRCWRIDWV